MWVCDAWGCTILKLEICMFAYFITWTCRMFIFHSKVWFSVYSGVNHPLLQLFRSFLRNQVEMKNFFTYSITICTSDRSTDFMPFWLLHLSSLTFQSKVLKWCCWNKHFSRGGLIVFAYSIYNLINIRLPRIIWLIRLCSIESFNKCFAKFRGSLTVDFRD